jgi:type I restriction enzyme M protein
VDNTPEPEPEDVQAHLIGGIPEAEVMPETRLFPLRHKTRYPFSTLRTVTLLSRKN